MPKGLHQISRLVTYYQKHGRKLNESEARKIAFEKLGKRENLTIRELIKLKKHFDVGRRRVSDKALKQLVDLFKENQSLPINQRKSYADLSVAISKKFPFSVNELKRASRIAKEELISQGKSVKRISVRSKKQIDLTTVRKKIERDINQGKNPTLNEVARHFKLTPRQLYDRLNEMGLNFRKLLTRVRYDQVSYFDIKTEGKLTRKEIAQKLGYSETLIKNALRGKLKISGSKKTKAAIRRKALAWINYFSIMQISITEMQIKVLSGGSPMLVKGVFNELIREGKLDKQKQGFIITESGKKAILNKGYKTNLSNLTLSQLEELKSTIKECWFKIANNVEYPKQMISLIDHNIKRKRNE